jgi:hypothetical protein
MTRLDAIVTALCGALLVAPILTSDALARLVHAAGVWRW